MDVKKEINYLSLSSSFPISENNQNDGSFIYDFLKGFANKDDYNVYSLVPHRYGSKFKEDMSDIIVYRFPYFFPTKYQNLAYDEGLPYKIKNFKLAKIQLPIYLLSQFIFGLIICYKKRITVINSHWLIPQGLVGALIKFFTGKYHIVTIHSSEVTYLSKLPFNKNIVSFIINNSDVIVSVSLHRANELKEIIPPKKKDAFLRKLKIIPMGVEEPADISEVEKESLKRNYNVTENFVILFVGRFVEVKGCEYLIKSILHLIGNIDNFIVILAGTGPLLSSQIKYVNENNLNNYVKFVGYINHDQINDYYYMSDLVVVPSIIDSYGYQEGLPVVAMEALSHGKPVIGSNTCGLMEIIENGETGLIVKQKSEVEIADAIINLCNDVDLYDYISKNSKCIGSKYYWAEIIKNYGAFIK